MQIAHKASLVLTGWKYSPDRILPVVQDARRPGNSK
jgi:hypothetical protein